jgi:hypothetical protein
MRAITKGTMKIARILLLCIIMSSVAVFYEAGEGAGSFSIEVAVGLEERGGVSWLEPGRPLISEGARGLVFSFLADSDCYLYAIVHAKAAQTETVLWPPLSTPEIVKASKGEILRLAIEGDQARDLRDGGAFSVLVFSKPPLALHAALGKGRADAARVDRIVRSIFKGNSRFLSSSPNDLALLAGTVRSASPSIMGYKERVDTFWGGVYEWASSAAP